MYAGSRYFIFMLTANEAANGGRNVEATRSRLFFMFIFIYAENRT